MILGENTPSSSSDHPVESLSLDARCAPFSHTLNPGVRGMQKRHVCMLARRLSKVFGSSYDSSQSSVNGNLLFPVRGFAKNPVRPASLTRKQVRESQDIGRAPANPFFNARSSSAPSLGVLGHIFAFFWSIERRTRPRRRLRELAFDASKIHLQCCAGDFARRRIEENSQGHRC